MQASRSRSYKYFDLIVASFVTVILCSNLIGPGKTAQVVVPWVGVPLTFGAGNLFFPISYIFGDVLTEVYGYSRARRAIWAGAGALLFASAMSAIILALPEDPAEPYNRVLGPALQTVFSSTWRIAVGSILAFWAGDFVNSYVLAKLKILTAGRLLWTRTIGSTVVGQLVDSLVFYPFAFAGIWVTATLAKVVMFNWIFKVMIEVVATPLTYVVVGALKRAEHEDYYDLGTNFTPFTLEE